MKRRNFIKSISVLPIISFIPSLFSKEEFPDKYEDYLNQNNISVDYGTGKYPKTVKELTEWMEAALPVSQSTDNSHSVTGEEYIESYSTMTGHDEERLCRYRWNFFMKQCRELEGDGHKLYWRIKPELSEWKKFAVDGSVHPGGTRVYMRYLISNKPEKLWKIGKPINIIADKDWKVQIGS